MKLKLTKEQQNYIWQHYQVLTKKDIQRNLETTSYQIEKFYLMYNLITPYEVIRASFSRKGDKWKKRRITKYIEPMESKQDYDLRYSTEFIKSNKMKFINFCDLPILRRLYDQDATVNDMAYELNTTKYNVLQGLEVLKMIDNVKAGKMAVDTGMEAAKPEVMPIDKGLALNRPPSVYSNSSPYGIARPGL